MNELKKVMIVGAVDGEVPLVQAFHDLGCYVIVVSNGINYPCFSLADKVYRVDIMDKEKLLEIAKEEKVCAITSNVVERAVRIVAWLAEKLGLEGIGTDISEDFTNKYKMRIAACRAGINIPEFGEASNLEEALNLTKRIGYPLIIKPVDNGGSRGVVKVSNDLELINNFNDSLQMSVSDSKVIIEQYITGVEYNVDAFVHNYICDNTDVAFKEKFEIDETCIPKNYVIQDANSCKTDIERRLLSTNKQLVEGMGLKFGITHANYIYQPQEDKIYLVEIAARGGGDGISKVMVQLATGINVSYLLACYSLGLDILGEKPLELKVGASAWYGFCLPAGKISKISGVDEAKKIEGVYDINTTDLQLGANVKELTNGSQKYGPVWVYGSDRDECASIIAKVKDTLQVEVTDSCGLVHKAEW